ncbi:hypothetical protein P3T76_010067 [Phytophthora citrophthora]|uniref:Uncharacterized protein n=1 Tax=Phytophthora citrophthora TaxID=4793 RepID=A0AAD9GDZ0_9STRA|nr:hypothetical protein P3T76_010067 [Phytophthora citrophthora]
MAMLVSAAVLEVAQMDDAGWTMLAALLELNRTTADPFVGCTLHTSSLRAGLTVHAVGKKAMTEIERAANVDDTVTSPPHLRPSCRGLFRTENARQFPRHFSSDPSSNLRPGTSSNVNQLEKPEDSKSVPRRLKVVRHAILPVI